MNNIVPIQLKKATLQASEKKWGKQVMKIGFNILPSLLFKAQRRLGLSSQQLVVLLHLTEHWWEYDRNPYPSITTIAKRMGLQRRQVQRIIADLEKAELIERIERRAKHKGKLSNEYNLSGLVSKLNKLSTEFLKTDEKIKALKKDVEKPKGFGNDQKEKEEVE